MRREPPWLADWLLRVSLPGERRDVIRGDLIEEFFEGGATPAARRRFWRHALSVAMRYRGRSRPGAAPTLDRSGGATMLESIAYDARYAVRSLRKRPGFVAVVLATLALGIGASTAIFSIFHGIVVKPLPFDDADRLVFARELDGGEGSSFAWPNYLDFKARAQSYERLAASQANSFTLTGVSQPRRVDGRLVTWDFFDVLRVRPQRGRSFTDADDRAGATPVALISDRFWRHELNADPGVLGRSVRMTELTFTVVGVLPPGFRYMRTEDFFVPIGLTITKDSGWLDRGNHFGLYAVGRLNAGVTVEQAHAEAQRIAADLAREYPNTNSGNGARVVLLKDRLINAVRETVVALMGAVGFLLLLACVNVSNLLIARGAARQHELAIRAALGGGRWRLVRQLLVESLMLSLAGGVLGLALAFWLVRGLVALAPPDIPRLDEISMNTASVFFGIGAALASGIVFGAFPAFQVSSQRQGHVLAGTTRTGRAFAPNRTRRVLMAAEVAIALVLLTGCGLMARTMMRLNAVDPGFRADSLLTGRLSLTGPAWTAERRRTFYGELLRRVSALPGVERAALTLSLPIEGSQWGSVFVVRDKPVPPRAELPSAAFVPVSTGYFDTMGIRLLRGRTFGPQETATSQRVTVVNESLAHRLWPGEDPIGKQLKQGWPETPEDQSPWREVIGVVADVKLEGVDQETPMQAFVPIHHDPARSVALVVRTTTDPASLISSVQAAVLSLDKDLPFSRPRTMTALMGEAISRQRLSATVLAMFALVAVLVAGVGLYGVIAHDVAERTRETGLRMALGAERGAVLRLFVRQGLVTAAIGAAAGLAAAVALSRWMQALLFDVTATDPLTYAAVVALLLGVSGVACYVPARRATRIDPLLALRTD